MGIGWVKSGGNIVDLISYSEGLHQRIADFPRFRSTAEVFFSAPIARDDGIIPRKVKNRRRKRVFSTAFPGPSAPALSPNGSTNGSSRSVSSARENQDQDHPTKYHRREAIPVTG